MIISGDIVNASQFAALEPSWAGIHGEPQLRGLLILGALFNRIIYVHDTQIADHPRLLKAYATHEDKPNNIYNLVTMLIEHRVMRVAIRDFTYIAAQDLLLPCHTLSDVHASWLAQGMFGAWVTPPFVEQRIQFLTDIDRILHNIGSLQYPYMDIKNGFMKHTREALENRTSSHYLRFARLQPHVREQYQEIIGRDWFSHSDVFELLTNSGLTLWHPFVQDHGLFDEASYAQWNQSRLLGCDSALWGAEALATGSVEPKRRTSVAPLSATELQQQAIRIIDSPGLSLIATLTGEEILMLREEAKELFGIIDLISESNFSDKIISDPQYSYIEAAMDYWEKICSFLRKSRPHLTQHPSKWTDPGSAETGNVT